VVAEGLRRLIQDGEIEQGTRLRQAEIAKRFNVSTTPVREAFVTLAREGLVRHDAHRGVVVFRPSAEELMEIYELRIVLEPLATEIAALSLTEEELAELDQIVVEMATADPDEYTELNRRLHTAIYEAADRPRILEIVDGLREAASSYLVMGFRGQDKQYDMAVQAEHEEIVAMLKERSPEKAGKAMRRHLERNAGHFREMVQSEDGPS
jgi:DNA-binding GntR family transcriptional regulator